MSLDPQAGISVKSRGRSRATNHPGRFVTSPGRSLWGRRFTDIVVGYEAQLGRQPTHAERSLIRRVATLECELEYSEGQRADGVQPLDVETYARVSSHLRRLLETIGIKPVKLIDVSANPLLDHFDRPAARAPT